MSSLIYEAAEPDLCEAEERISELRGQLAAAEQLAAVTREIIAEYSGPGLINENWVKIRLTEAVEAWEAAKK